MVNDFVPVVDASADPSLRGKRASRERVIRAVQTGDARGGRVAGRWLVDPASLRDWLNRQSETAGTR